MRANYANIKKRYCQKLGEQILWEDNEDFVPVQGTGIGRRTGPVLNKAQDYEEVNEQELSGLPQRQTSEAHRDGQRDDEHSDAETSFERTASTRRSLPTVLGLPQPDLSSRNLNFNLCQESCESCKVCCAVMIQTDRAHSIWGAFAWEKIQRSL